MLETFDAQELNEMKTTAPDQCATVEPVRYWYALYTRHHFEKSVGAELVKLGLHAYLPLRSTLRQWSDRKKWIEEPLFSCYVFVHANATERLLSLRPSGVVRMLCTGGQPARIPEAEIQTVQRILENGYDPEPVNDMQPGDLVEITSGPLTGVRGLLMELRGQKRLSISFESIGRSVSINIKRDRVKKIATASDSRVSRKPVVPQPLFAGRF